MTEEIVKILSVDAGDSQTSVKQLRKEIKLLKDELLNLDETSAEYDKVLGALSDRMFAMRDMNELARYSAADLGEQIATVNRIATGLASGFGAVQGAMALFGSESETVEKTMVRLQGVIALVQGLQGLEGLSKDLKAASIQFRDTTKAVKGFIGGLSGVKKALLATGIGVFITLLGVLITNWDKVSKLWNDTSAEESATAAIDKLELSVKNLNEQLSEKNTEALKKYTEELNRAAGNSKKIADATSEYNKQLRENALLIAKQKLEEAYEAEKVAYAAYVKKQNDATLEALNKSKDAIKEAQSEVVKAENDIALAESKILEETVKKTEEANKQKTEKAIELAKKQKEEVIKQLESIEDRLYNSLNTEITLRTEQFKKEKALFEQNGKDITKLQTEYDADIAKLQAQAAQEKLDKIKEDSDKIVEQLNSSISNIQQSSSNKIDTINLNYSSSGISKNPQTAYENEVAYNNAIFQAKSEAINQENSLLLAQLNNEQLTADARKEIQQQLFDNNIELSNLELETKKKNTDAEISLEKKKQQAKQATYNGLSSILSATATLIGENTKAGKAAAVASTLINTWASAEEAYRAAFNPGGIWSPALGAVYMAAAIATGLANVKSIMSVNTESGTGSSSAASASVVTPSLDIGRSMPVGYTRNLLSDTETDNLNNSQKVYVLESDITNTQNKVNVVESNATF